MKEMTKGREEGKKGSCLMGTEFLFGVMKKFWKWMMVMDCTTIVNVLNATEPYT